MLLTPRHTPWWIWPLSGFALAWPILLWLTDRTDDNWVSSVVFSVWMTQAYNWASSQPLLTGGLLVNLRGMGTPQRIPLATAEIRQLPRGWQVRWKEGRMPRKQTFRLPLAFGEALERAALSASSAPEGMVPRTVKEADHALAAAPLATRQQWYLWAVGALSVGALGVSFWMNNPVPWVLAFAILFRLGFVKVKRLVLEGARLWVISDRGEAHQIPLELVTSYSDHRGHLVLRTADPLYPELRVNRYLGDELVRRLKRILTGELEMPKEEKPTVKGAARCTLCGRTDPSGAAPGAIYICDLCANRARVEAKDTGHGIDGKDPKPM